jgi:hypothetical protein
MGQVGEAKYPAGARPSKCIIIIIFFFDKSVKEDKPSKPIPKEAGRTANRLLYGTPKAMELKAGTEKDRHDQEGVEWVAQ